MSDTLDTWGLFRPLTWDHVILVLAVLLVARLLSLLVRWALRYAAESARPRFRLAILRLSPILRLLIGLAAVIFIVPIVIEPTLQNVVALIASVGLVLAFGLKDYASSLLGGLATVLENAYQPGDWIEIGGTYGEVKAITLRAVRIVTADDTEVIIPHSRLWSTNVANATSGNRSLLCVTPFYLHPDHDAEAVRSQLEGVVRASSHWKPDTPVDVIVMEKPWGTQYRVKAYVKESRDQFQFITDLTIRGKASLRANGLRFAQAPYAETPYS